MSATERMVETFSYHRSVAPLLWVLVAIAAVELLVTHLLVATLIGPRVAAPISLVTFAAVTWLVLAIRSMRRLPVRIDAERLLVRSGWIKRVEVPTSAIARLDLVFDAASLKDGSTLNLALVAYPNVVIILDPPYQDRRRLIRRVAHRLDEPAAFARAVERLIAAR